MWHITSACRKWPSDGKGRRLAKNASGAGFLMAFQVRVLREKTSVARFRHASIVRVSMGSDFQHSMSISRTSASMPLGPMTVINSDGDLLVRRNASQLMGEV